MVGGKVIEVAEIAGRPEVIYVDCRDHNDTCAVLVERNANSERIEIGDSLWWQCGNAYWTPLANKGKPGNKCGRDFDIKIPKIGYSGSLHPSRKAV